MLKHVIFFLCFIGIGFSQNQKCELIFKDGTSIQGYGSLTKKDSIKFRIDRESKPDVWGNENVQRITFFGFENTEVTFEYVKAKWQRKYELMEVVVDGDIKLYARFSANWTTTTLNYGSRKGANYTPSQKNTDFALFLKKPTDEKVIPVSTGLFSGWKKKMLAYFKECPEVTEGIESGEYKSGDMKKLVEDYNIYCTE